MYFDQNNRTKTLHAANNTSNVTPCEFNFSKLKSTKDFIHLVARADQNGEEVEYRSDSEMARALAALDAEIAAKSARPANTIHFKISKGL
jgi:hypothetical protein